MSRMVSVDEALALIQAHPLLQASETVSLDQAFGRCLASDVTARISRPPANVSAMDGYAVRLADVVHAGSRLSLIGAAPAGTLFEGIVGAGETVRVFTGSEIPVGADHVIIQENVERDGDLIVCSQAESAARHIRSEGLDFSEGDVVLTKGRVLDAAALSVAAAANWSTLSVRRRPRVGILSNGDELRPAGSDLEPGQIINSNPAALSALVSQWGGIPVDLGIAGDSTDSIKAFIEAGDGIDLFLPIGGASVGDHDHMRTAFAELGFEPIFEKIAVKPGKPTWFSQRGGQRVLGLPGNPASALVCAILFAAPLLGSEFLGSELRAIAGIPLGRNGPREQFLRATVKVEPSGVLSVEAASNQDSSLLRPFLDCNALLRRAKNAPTVDAGGRVDVILIKPLLG